MELFEGLVGQESAKRLLGQGVPAGTLPQTLVFAGPRGVGRKTAARLLARGLHNSSAPIHPDTFWFGEVLRDKRERNITSPVKAAADEMTRFLQMTPMTSTTKVAVVEDGAELTEEAQSALLKTLEEPRSNSVVVLIVETEEGLLPTILSRSQVVKFGPLSEMQMYEVLGEKADAEIIRLANGSAGRALELLADPAIASESKRLHDFWKSVGQMSVEEKFRWSDAMKEREAATAFLEEGLRCFHQQLAGGETKVAQVLEVEKALQKVRDNANVRVSLDALMLVL